MYGWPAIPRTMPVAELVRYQISKSGNEQDSFKEYIGRMKEGQNDVYHITIVTIAAVSSSLLIETLKRKH